MSAVKVASACYFKKQPPEARLGPQSIPMPCNVLELPPFEFGNVHISIVFRGSLAAASRAPLLSVNPEPRALPGVSAFFAFVHLGVGRPVDNGKPVVYIFGVAHRRSAIAAIFIPCGVSAFAIFANSAFSGIHISHLSFFSKIIIT
jgi:hypothetical protein